MLYSVHECSRLPSLNLNVFCLNIRIRFADFANLADLFTLPLLTCETLVVDPVQGHVFAFTSWSVV